MVLMEDIYRSVDKQIIDDGFWSSDINGKKQLIEVGLKNYMVRKIGEVSGGTLLPNEMVKGFSTPDVFRILCDTIPKEQHFDTVRHVIHYILNVAGNMQGWAVTWWDEEDIELIEMPRIEFNGNNLWDKLITHKETDYTRAFNFVYAVFQDEFLKNSHK